ncbi:hypothetical protein CDAR_248111 [Caerostris darwini]|uniref:Uncharacterized protein n=1 Tax=Caerostris darwini TaxID=1538125 RepID=A0AAV4TK44_9ARAC|nr:hypothetical protein CDAR_248111 [Caerostris darwini]
MNDEFPTFRKLGYGKQDEEECRRISNIKKNSVMESKKVYPTLKNSVKKQDKEECRRISNIQKTRLWKARRGGMQAYIKKNSVMESKTYIQDLKKFGYGKQGM